MKTVELETQSGLRFTLVKTDLGALRIMTYQMGKPINLAEREISGADARDLAAKIAGLYV